MSMLFIAYWPKMLLKNGVYLNKSSGRRLKRKVEKLKNNYWPILFLFVQFQIWFSYSGSWDYKIKYYIVSVADKDKNR
jgi:hypothetical protein